jgi:hypothetical protein
MSWRTTFLTGILAAGLMQMSPLSPFASTAWADDDHDHHYDHDRHSDHDGNHDHARWRQEHHESDHDGHVHGDNTRDCGAIHERIRYDSERVHQIDPAKHPKARQWYKDDINNTKNDLRNCRG